VDLGFADATAVIAGGTRGIGLATAMCLAEHGARVGIIGRNETRLTKAAAALAAAGSPEVLTFGADLGSAADVHAVFETVSARWNALNVLVNAAGPVGAGRFEDLGDAAWTATFDQGVISAVRCVRAALPLLRAAPWARVVNVTAMSVQHQSAGLVSYTAAKSALLSVTKNLARSLAGDAILVNAVAPGPILTDWARPISPPPESRWTTRWAPSGYWGATTACRSTWVGSACRRRWPTSSRSAPHAPTPI
jgi:NAD(P)-dependent dehydrogenase (short-subunit alcohol dehydrogenase family)